MNKWLYERTKNEAPQIPNLSDIEQKRYRMGLQLLAVIAKEDFFDIPPLPDNRFDTNGLFYTIPYFDDDTLWHNSTERTMIVLYHVENKSSFCPMRLEFDMVDENNVTFYVYDQRGERTTKHLFFGRENGTYYTEYTNYEQLALSDLLD